MGSAPGLLFAVVQVGAFLLCGVFIMYVIVILVPYLRHRPGEIGDGAAFRWHFLIPCRDEERVVAGTVSRLLRDFPSATLWCIDDASRDRTAEILADLAAQGDRVHIVSRRLPEARQGKGPALNAGWCALGATEPDPDHVIVGVVDADGRLDPRCLDVITGPALFGDPTVGAVQIKVRIETGERSFTRQPARRLLVRLQDVEFAALIPAMQMLRKHLGSVGLGGNGQFTRLEVLNAIAAEHGTPWHGALLEDFELGLHVLFSGSRTAYCDDTWVAQQGLASLRKLTRQRCRWAQGSMQCRRYFLAVLRSPSIGTPAALEIAYFLSLPWVQVLGSLIYAVSVALLVTAMVVAPGGLVAWLDAGGWGFIPLYLLFGLAPLVVWGPVYKLTVEREMSWPRAIGLGIANWPYVFVNYVADWWAFSRVLRCRHDWQKTERTGAAAPMAAVVAAGEGPYAHLLSVTTAESRTIRCQTTNKGATRP